MEKNKKNKNEISDWFAPILYFGLKDQAYDFVENISYFLTAGMSLSMALSSMEDEISGNRMKNLCKRIQFDIENGLSLSQSFEKQKFFSSP